MSWPKAVYDQIKNKTVDEIVSALKKDGWLFDESRGAIHVYYNPLSKRRVTIHYHPRKTYKSVKLLEKLISDDIGWSIEDMKRLKLIKK